MRPLKFTFTFKWNDAMLARLIMGAAIILAGSLITFAVTFVLDTLSAAFTVPTQTIQKDSKEKMLLAPDLIERVRSAQEARLIPAPAIPADLYDPFAPVIVPPSPPPAAVETPPATPPPA